MNNPTPRRQRVFEIIQIGREADRESRMFDFAIVLLILINILIAVCSTFSELARFERLFHTVEAVTVLCFTAELGLRLWTADLLYGYGCDRVRAALRYLVSFNGVVEVLSIVPFFLPLIFPHGVVAFRMFRVFRIVRLFQANVYSDALYTIMLVVRRKRRQLVSSLLIIFVIMLMASLLMYGFEHQAQPMVYKNAFSGIWWATSTLLTVGYGDIYPITAWGRVASIVITFLGVGMVAIPTGILSAGFIEVTSERRDALIPLSISFCPHCGEALPPTRSAVPKQ